jgi:hypothetical protein
MDLHPLRIQKQIHLLCSFQACAWDHTHRMGQGEFAAGEAGN